jgi:hypothetical protein
MGLAAGRPSLPQAFMCSPGVLCIGPARVPTVRSPEFSYVLPGHTTTARVGAESKGKVPASTCPSQDLLVHVPGVSSDPAKYLNILFILSNCCFLCEAIGSILLSICTDLY